MADKDIVNNETKIPSAKKTGKLRTLFILPNRRVGILAAVILIILIGAAAFWYFNSRVTVEHENADTRTTIFSDGTAIINGERVIYDQQNMQSDEPPDEVKNMKAPDNKEIIRNLEALISSDKATVEDLIELGQYYEAEKMSEEALATYKRARQAVTSETPDSDILISYIEGSIARLEEQEES